MAMEYQHITDKGVLGKIYAALEQDTQMGLISSLGLKTTSTSASEKYAWLGQVPVMREWLGPRIIKKLSEQSYTLVNKKYEATLGVQQDDLDRDKVNQLNARISEFAQRANSHWIKLMSDLMITNGTCYDGQNFFDTDHSEGDSGTQKNSIAKADYAALDFTTTGKPTALEMATAILSVVGHMYTLKDDQGEPINETAKKFLVVCPTVEYWRASISAVRDQNLQTSGGASVTNPLAANGDLSVSVDLNIRLNQTSYTQYFYVYRTDAPVKPFILQEESGGVKQQTLDQNSDHYFFNDEKLYGLKAKRAAGYGLWQYAIRADGTT